MAIRKKYDKVFLGLVLTLLFFGFFVLASASLGLAAREDKNYYLPILKQIALGGGVGFIFLIITSKIPYKKWKTISLPLFLFSFILTVLVFESHFGFEHGGAKRWLSFGIGNFTFQPSELLKIAFVIYLASWLSKRQKEMHSFKKVFLPFLAILGFISIVLILQPDMGTLGVIAFTSLFLFLLAGGKITHAGLVILLGVILFSTLIFFKPYLKERVNVFLNSTYDIQGAGYQLNQSKIAIGSGGILGKGFGKGLAKFNYLPEPTGDSIFAVIGEEFGFMGTSFLIFLFLCFLFKSLRIAVKTTDLFGRLLVSGIAILITVQSFVNMYAVVGLIPLTGLPLIFISQGGSALALTLAGVGIILNVSRN